MRALRFLAVLASLVFLALPALAEAAAPSQIVITDPTGGLLSQSPVAFLAFAVLSLIASAISALVPDSKLPAVLRKVVNGLALNVNRAKNDPAKN